MSAASPHERASAAPGAFLARPKKEEARKKQARLKLFFGAAAGGGKTYTMLEAAHALLAEGVDVLSASWRREPRVNVLRLNLALDGR